MENGFFVYRSALFFLVLLLVGLYVYPDYGVSWDEPIVVDYGMMLQRYLVEGDLQFVTAFDRYQGSLIPMLLAFFDTWMGEASSRDKYLYHHLFNFLLFWLGLWSFFGLARKRWGDGNDGRTTSALGE